MPTNKISQRNVEQFMSGYQPVYQPLYSLLLGRAQEYAEEVGKVDLKRAQTIGDIRAREITPKDTEIRQITVGDAKKSFKKYFMANQYIRSQLQNGDDDGDVVAQVLDEHQKQFDEIVITGAGTSVGDVVNNGLFWSADANYIVKDSVAVSATPDHLSNLHSLVMGLANDADLLAGQKVIIFYGSNALAKLDGIYANSNAAFRRTLADALGDSYEIVKMPSTVTPASSHGLLIVNLDQIKLHYTKLPALDNQGTNEEKLYDWYNFMMGSAMVEVLASGAIVKQPLTFA